MIGAADLPYRRCVGIVLLNGDGRMLVARRRDTPDAWQMPQGGIDPGEDPRAAAFRELKEEIGTDNAEIVAELDGWLRYELPEHLIGKVWQGRYRGQEQKWFALRFLGRDEEIDLDAAADDEFDAWRWATADEALAGIVPFKREVYAAVIDGFRHLMRSPASP
ncbi:MAG TPA: RNA pyrophosphohydrolase [Alphaproteobacteria bacterium]|nr:RNA pyrophosphohydrolase [Alphaproteobacteria bacterium]